MSTPQLLSYSIVDGEGRVVQHGIALQWPEPPAGQRVVEGHPPSAQHYRDGDAWVRQSDAPSGAHVFDWASKTWIDPRTLAQLRISQLAAVDAGFNNAASRLTAGYPVAEQLTWPIQQAEALAWAVDPDASTPYLDGIAAARGIAPEAMRIATLGNVNVFLAASQRLVGRRQALRDAVNAATTAEAIESVVWTD